MSKVRYDVCVADKRGEKTYWNRIGVVLQTEKGFSMKINAVPVGWDGWCSLFEPKSKEDRAPAKDDAPW